MKKYMYFTFLLFFYSIFSYSQEIYEFQSTAIQTPTGESISAQQFKYWDYDDFDEDEVEYWNWYWTHESNNVILANSTKYYNCHGYAWHNVEGNMAQSDLRSIWDLDPYNLAEMHIVEKYYSSTYANKPAYKQVGTNYKTNLKVSYYPRDHSALTTSDPNYFISKLAYGPLVKHTPWDIPFAPNSQIKYYDLNDVSIKETNNNYTLLCSDDNRLLACTNFVNTDFGYCWDTGSYIDEISGDGTRYLHVKGTTGDGGKGTVSLTVTSPSGLTATSNILTFQWAGKPGPISLYDDPTYFMCNQMNIVNVDYGDYTYYEMGVNEVDWSYQGTTLSNINDGFTKAYITAGSSPGNGYIYVDISNTCPGGTNGNRAYYEIECFHMMLTITPNPANGETIVSIVEEGEDSELKSASLERPFDTNTEWDLEVYDSNQNLKAKQIKLKGNSTKLQTSGWKEGVYIVRAKYNDEILTDKLVVKK